MELNLNVYENIDKWVDKVERDRILIVDDNEGLCKTLSLILKKRGYEIEITGVGSKAIKIIKEKDFNVTILDIKLPDIEGVDLLKKLKEIKPNMEIIMITAHATLESSVRALNDGASAFITKPLNIDDLLIKIKNIVEKQRLIEEKRRDKLKIERLYSELDQLFNIAVPLCVIDKDFNLIRINQSFASIFHIQKDKLIGKKCYEVMPSKSCNTSECTMNKVLNMSDSYEHEKDMEFNAGLKLTCLVRAVPYRGTDNEVIGIIQNFTDITARKKIEESLKISEKKYKKAYNRANFYKDLFTHDISNILQNLNSSIELIAIYQKNLGNEKKIHEIRDIFENQVGRALKLVLNVRKLSELEEHAKPIKKIEVFKLLKNAINFLNQTYNNREIKIQVDSFSKEFYVNANELLLDVFENILINAGKFNKNKIVEISIKTRKKPDFFSFEFKDNGIGISDNLKEKIFIRGFRKKSKIKGLGLGLSLVKEIINTYNGKIWVEDRVKGDHSKGSNFIINLPRIP